MDKNRILSSLQKERDKLFCYACYRLRSSEEAEDALQDLYLALVSRSPTLKVSNVVAYMYRSLPNICTSRLREAAKLPLTTIDGIDIMDEPRNFSEDAALINKLLSVIPEEQSEVIRLRLHSDLTFKEIAEIVNQPVTTVKARYKYGLNHIRVKLQMLNQI